MLWAIVYKNKYIKKDIKTHSREKLTKGIKTSKKILKSI
jgi:hypothetical protein